MTNWAEATNKEIMHDVAREANKDAGYDYSLDKSETSMFVPSKMFEILVNNGYVEPVDREDCAGFITEDLKAIFPSVPEGIKVIKNQFLQEDCGVYVKEAKE